MAEVPTGYARCPNPGCRRRHAPGVKLTSKGNLRAHSRYSRPYSGEYDTRCPASGHDPKTWKPS